MLSKFLDVCQVGLRAPIIVFGKGTLVFSRVPVRDPRVTCVRHAAIFPKTQYDAPFSKKLKPFNMMRNNWEVIPLFFVTSFALTIMCLSIFWACGHKVDVSFNHTNCDTISRTMDLRNPSNHKLLIINQKYEPWPEMQDAVDKVKNAERELLKSVMKC